MTRYKCLECQGDLVQMLEREPWDTKLDEGQIRFENPSRHYGFYCKVCQIMYKEKMYLVRDEVQSSNTSTSEKT